MNQQEIINILKEDLDYNIKDITKHKELFNLRGSNKQRDKMRKHMYRVFYIKGLLMKLGFKVCNECGSITKRNRIIREGLMGELFK